MSAGMSESNKMGDGTEPPKLSTIVPSRKVVENSCSLENQTTIAEKRMGSEGMNKFTAQQEPTASDRLKMSRSLIKDSPPKEDSSSVHLMSGAVRTLKQPKEQEPLRANNVKHAALASSTNSAVNPRVAGYGSSSSTKPLESISESFQGHTKSSGTSKASCFRNEPDVNKPPKKRRTYYGAVNGDHQNSVNVAHSAHNTCGDAAGHDRSHSSLNSARDSVPSESGELHDDRYLLNADHSVRRLCEQALPDPFWKELDSFIAPITPLDEFFLKLGLNSTEELNQSQSQDVPNHNCSRGGEKSYLDKRSTSSVEGLDVAKMSSAAPSLYQRALSALITEDECNDVCNPNERRSLSFDPMGMPSSSLSDTDCAVDIEEILESEIQSEDDSLSFDDKLLQELHCIGVYPEAMPNLEDKEEWVDREIKELEEKLCQTAATKKKQLEKIQKAIQPGDFEKRKLEELASGQLALDTYLHTMADRSKKYARGLGAKPAKETSDALIHHALAICKELEGMDPAPREDLGLSGSQPALAHSSKEKEIMITQSGNKDEGVTADRKGKRKMVDTDFASLTSNFLVNSSGTDNIPKETSKEMLPSAKPTADNPHDAMVTYNDELRKAAEFASPAHVIKNAAKETGSIDKEPTKSYTPSKPQ